MAKRIPKILYKYRRCNKDSIENFENNLVWCGTLDKYNDPYEGYTTIKFLPIYKAYLNIQTHGYYEKELNQLSNEQEMIKFVASKLKKSPEQIEKQISMQKKFQEEQNKIFRKKHQRETVICAFAEDFDNRLMWSHYANDHEGFCIAYETEQMKKFLYKVKYKNEIFDVSGDIIKIMTNKEKTKTLLKKIKPHKMVIQKDNIWAYEKEWRLINPITGDNIKDKDFYKKIAEKKGYTFPLTPSEIYLGTKISDSNKNVLINIAKIKKIKVNQIVMSEDNYQLSYETILNG